MKKMESIIGEPIYIPHKIIDQENQLILDCLDRILIFTL
jgi:hypothetical protein